MQSLNFILKAKLRLFFRVITLLCTNFFLNGSETLIFKSSQKHQFRNIPAELVLESFERVNGRPQPGILFNPSRLMRILHDGTCSSMSLGFLEAYMRMKKNGENLSARDLEYLEKCFSCTTIPFICLQIAFNCIEVDLSAEVQDISRSKIQALANYYGLEIDLPSHFLDIREENSFSSLRDLTESLPIGCYLLRLLEPAENTKMEIKGHSIAYIKRNEGSYLYDPNEGLYQIFDEDFVLIHRICMETYREYGVYLARFYRLTTNLLFEEY